MGLSTLYVTNFPADIHEQDLGDLFAQFGSVIALEPGMNARFGVPYALMTMQSEKAARQANHTLNGYRFDDMPLAVSYPDIDQDVITRGLSAKQRQTAEFVVLELHERYRKPVRRIHTLILVCGHSFALNMLDIAKEVEQSGGMLTVDGRRRRSMGGVFFSLVNRNISPTIYQLIHTRGGKLPDYRHEDDRMFYHLIINPHEGDVTS